MASETNHLRPPPGELVPRHFRIWATAAVACGCVWLVIQPRLAQQKMAPVIHRLPTLVVDSEHGWPLTAFHFMRATGWYEHSYHFRKTIYPVWVERLDGLALAYDLVVIGALIVLTRLFFLPWQAYPEPKVSLAEIFVWLSSLSVGLAFGSALLTANSWKPVGQDTSPTVELIPWFVIWLVGTGTASGIVGHFGWLSARRRAWANESTAGVQKR